MFNFNKITEQLPLLCATPAPVAIPLVKNVVGALARLKPPQPQVLKRILCAQAKGAFGPRGPLARLRYSNFTLLAIPFDTLCAINTVSQSPEGSDKIRCVLTGVNADGGLLRGYSRGQAAVVYEMALHTAFTTQCFELTASEVLIKGALEMEMKFANGATVSPVARLTCVLTVVPNIPAADALSAILAMDITYARFKAGLLTLTDRDFAGLPPLLAQFCRITGAPVGEVAGFHLPLKRTDVETLCDLAHLTAQETIQALKRWQEQVKKPAVVEIQSCIPPRLGSAIFRINPPNFAWMCAKVIRCGTERSGSPLRLFKDGHQYTSFDQDTLDELRTSVDKIVSFCCQDDHAWEELHQLAQQVHACGGETLPSKPV